MVNILGMHITTIITIQKNYLPISSINKVNRPVKIYRTVFFGLWLYMKKYPQNMVLDNTVCKHFHIYEFNHS